ncbi:MAG: hypothetical protein ACRDKZ_09935 [Actinomycetota bacterium]
MKRSSRRSRGSAVAACLLALVAPPVHAQESAEGGGSFEEAPTLQTGTYSDSIRSGETLFWAVELAETERVQARARVTSPGDHPPAEVRLTLYNSLRREDELSSDGEQIGDRGEALVGASSTPVAAHNTDYPEPGTHFLSVAVEALDEPRQFDLTLSIEVARGEPLTAEGNRVVPSSRPPPTEEPEPSRFGTYAALFAGGALIGALGLLLKGVLFGPGRRLRQGL